MVTVQSICYSNQFPAISLQWNWARILLGTPICPTWPFDGADQHLLFYERCCTTASGKLNDGYVLNPNTFESTKYSAGVHFSPHVTACRILLHRVKAIPLNSLTQYETKYQRDRGIGKSYLPSVGWPSFNATDGEKLTRFTLLFF